MDGKTTRGRQKIGMKPIENESDRLVTFSKRRAGIYKKANELAALCHASIALVIFSPSGKPFAFASPSLDSVLHRFKGRNLLRGNPPNGVLSISREEETRRNEEFNELKALIECQKLRERELELRTGSQKGKGWWDDPVGDLTIDGVYKQVCAYTELQKALGLVISQRNGGASSSGRTSP